MSLQFVIGNAGSGKSTYLYRHVIAEAIKHPQKNYLVIVPEQFTMHITTLYLVVFSSFASASSCCSSVICSVRLVSSARTCRYHTQTTSAATAAIERNITYAGFIRIAFLRFFKICLSSFFFLCSFLGSSCRCGMTSAWRTVFPYMYIPRLVTVRLSACIL